MAIAISGEVLRRVVDKFERGAGAEEPIELFLLLFFLSKTLTVRGRYRE
jgi:hypothetical protein